VAAVECRDVRFAEPLSGRDDRRVDGSERKVRIRLDELCHSLKVRRGGQLEPELSTRGRPQQRRLTARAERFPDEVRRLGERERRNNERARLALEQLGTGGVVRIVADGRGDERPGVDDQSYGVNPSASRRSSASRTENPFSALPSPIKLSSAPFEACSCSRYAWSASDVSSSNALRGPQQQLRRATRRRRGG
jgi:hypothetical protein